jgi:hypothetical protein
MGTPTGAVVFASFADWKAKDGPANTSKILRFLTVMDISSAQDKKRLRRFLAEIAVFRYFWNPTPPELARR